MCLFARFFNPNLGVTALMALTATVSTPEIAAAATISELQGAWVINSATCSGAFAKKNGRIAFRPNPRFIDTSFIIDGKRIQGARATCTLGSEKQTPEGLKVILNCASRMMVGPLPVTLRVPDPNTIVKFDPDFPELETTFTRCD
ncbi:hypothetical protein [Microvirga puerhi]|uniref:DUF2147 domain-containing protein n=1 Tax=Microvirga puerhi TaxID=2876078 RepID=A0ABS7VHR4_9HYPH|nr:hypothetical protein [Microvirga puerhi]MBZ6074710.1 hypothetical protein [Microvirga puerhi]